MGVGLPNTEQRTVSGKPHQNNKRCACIACLCKRWKGNSLSLWAMEKPPAWCTHDLWMPRSESLMVAVLCFNLCVRKDIKSLLVYLFLSYFHHFKPVILPGDCFYRAVPCGPRVAWNPLELRCSSSQGCRCPERLEPPKYLDNIVTYDRACAVRSQFKDVEELNLHLMTAENDEC